MAVLVKIVVFIAVEYLLFLCFPVLCNVKSCDASVSLVFIALKQG